MLLVSPGMGACLTFHRTALPVWKESGNWTALLSNEGGLPMFERKSWDGSRGYVSAPLKFLPKVNSLTVVGLIV
jgi:hypothetical protein